MADLVPVLIGTEGLVAGECFLLDRGTELVIGRSRSCDISLRRTAGYLKAPAEQRDADHDFNTVSRRHLRIKVEESRVALQDLSTNGTYCNGEALKSGITVDLAGGACQVRLGTREAFQLQLLPADDERVRNLQPVGSQAPAAP